MNRTHSSRVIKNTLNELKIQPQASIITCCMNFHNISLNEIKSLENNCGCDPSPQLNNATCDTWRNKTLPLGTENMADFLWKKLRRTTFPQYNTCSNRTPYLWLEKRIVAMYGLSTSEIEYAFIYLSKIMCHVGIEDVSIFITKEDEFGNKTYGKNFRKGFTEPKLLEQHSNNDQLTVVLNECGAQNFEYRPKSYDKNH
uniref:Uncharacterized protein n=1 Tax=Acrobeloides nanus TaxID=290746 RepID=A0A914EC68_9BILA